VVTVLNEARSIGGLLEGLRAQTRPADEVLVVDGGSTDGTADLARSHPGPPPGLEVLAAPGTNIAAGRNRGIARARGALIAVTDGGCVPDPAWLEHLLEPLLGDPTVGLVSGVVRPEPRSHLEACIGACSLAWALRIGDARFFPTARTLAFRRDAWVRAGGFPEHLDYGEDTRFILDVAASGTRAALAPEAVVAWRPRRGYREVGRQFFHYADGLARAGLSRPFHTRTLVQSAAGLALATLGLATGHWAPWALLAALAAAYLWRKGRQGCFAVPSWRTYLRVPLVLLVIHVATVAGAVHGHLCRGVRH
jgi:glycosyltransferase involved in cell wall biosynthesis